MLLIAAYLCVGAAWKVWMVVRHPPAGTPMDDALREALRPYSSLPVGYALGPSFGRLAAAIRLASRTSEEGESAFKRAERLDRQVIRGGGTWAGAAELSLANLEQRSGAPGAHDGSQTLLIFLDEQRWGRTTVPRSSTLQNAMARYRLTAERYPHSSVAGDALDHLASLEDAQWEFHDARVCRLTTALLEPGRVGDPGDVFTRVQTDDPEAASLATAYYTYLTSSRMQRNALAPSLREWAEKAEDGALARSLTGGGDSPGSLSSETGGGMKVPVTWDGHPLAGARVALLQIGSLQREIMAGQAFASRTQQESQLSPDEVARTVDQMNQARTDDPLRVGAMALISPPMAARIAERLPVAPTGSDGVARLQADPTQTAGLAVLLSLPSASLDLSPAPFNGADGNLSVRFVPRVRVLPPVLSADGPPLLCWQPYPGAVRYRVAVALEPPAGAGSQSTAISPDWDRHIAWWQDGVRGDRVVMDPRRFVGPAGDLTRNGLWQGVTYRVIVAAMDKNGRTLSSSIGLRDHLEEFFRERSNWLALSGPDARTPAHTDAYGLDLGRSLFVGRRRRRGQGRGQPGQNGPGQNAPGQSKFGQNGSGAGRRAADPLQRVLDRASAQSPMSLAGTGDREPHLSPVPAGSSAAVSLARWPQAPRGQGPIPLQSPLITRFLQRSSLSFALGMGGG